MYCINQVPTCVNNNQEGGDVPNYLRDTFTYSSPHSRPQHRARRSAACSPCGVVGKVPGGMHVRLKSLARPLATL